jgi:hypothetical protein
MTKSNGNGAGKKSAPKKGVSPPAYGTVVMDPDEEHPPGKVMDLAAACVRFVQTKYKIEPDFTKDTLSVVDHYVEEARASIASRPETLALTAHAVGAYIGEVARRTHACWWRIDHGDPGAWRLEFRNVYLSFYPVQVVYGSLTHDDDEASFGGFELPESDRDHLLDRLASLPKVSDVEYYAPSTKLEVLDIVVDAMLAQRAHQPGIARPYEPSDYEGG